MQHLTLPPLQSDLTSSYPSISISPSRTVASSLDSVNPITVLYCIMMLILSDFNKISLGKKSFQDSWSTKF